MTRRFGSIRELASGRSQALYEHRLLGRQFSATFDTKPQAETWLAEQQQHLRSGEWHNPTGTHLRLSDFFIPWLSGRTLAPRTRELYDGLWSRYIAKTLGSCRFGELTPTAVRVWHSGLVTAARPGPVTVAKAYRLLCTVTNDAVRDGLLLRSPCTIRGAGSERSPEMRTITVEQVLALSKAMPAHLSVMVMVAAFSGLRWGELTGLTRGSVDTSAGTIRVHQALIETTSGEISFGPPKSEAGRRIVHLPSVVMVGLAEHLLVRSVVDESALVFTTLTGCPLRRSGFVKIWRTSTTSAELPGLRFHDLRHTAATLATVNGATVREVQARLGHSTAQAALRYQHATSDRDRQLAETLGLLIA